MQGLTVTVTTDAEKCILPFSHWSVKSIRSGSPVHGVSIKEYDRSLVKSVYKKNIFFLFLKQNICCGYSKELSQ